MSGRILSNDDAIVEAARNARHIAVLGIKPESRSNQPAHYVPAYMQEQGARIVPVPVYYPEVTTILGQAVVRDVRAVGSIDMVNVFRRSQDLAAHLDDLLALAPPLVWFQLGIRDDAVAGALADAGIDVVQNRCLLVEHRRGG